MALNSDRENTGLPQIGLQTQVHASHLPRASQAALGMSDLRGGLARFELWGMLGWHDIKQRYRRSFLGPWWLTLSTAFMIGALGVVYHAILKVPLQEYMPFLATGLVTWTLLASIIVDACQTLIGNENVIKQIRLPFTIHACRLVWRNVIIFCHNLVIIVVVAVAFRVVPRLDFLPLVIAAVVAIGLNGIWMALVLGPLCARFRDIPQTINSLVQLVFFITPIIWHPSVLPGNQRLVAFNPFHHFVDIVRAPMLGGVPSLTSWVVVIGITLCGWLISLIFLARYRRRFSYWL